jgi:Na+-transporting methylmalonyl-CoA/oxaloacetate decarboxylase gamma subunit
VPLVLQLTFTGAVLVIIIIIIIIIIISFMELGHLLNRSGLTHPEVSSKVCHDSFCQLGSSVSLSWVIY